MELYLQVVTQVYVSVVSQRLLLARKCIYLYIDKACKENGQKCITQCVQL